MECRDKDNDGFEKDYTLALHPDIVGHLDGIFLPFYHKVVIMQSIADIDQNEKEIFDADIVKLGDYPYNGSIEIVKWGTCGFKPFIDKSCPVYEDDDVGETQPDPHMCEIIGNIFETPWLIPKYEEYYGQKRHIPKRDKIGS